jgi:hypothetical protein
MDMLKQVFKSKTMMFALALAIFGVIEMNLKVFAPYLSPAFFGWFSILISVIVAILRVFTTLPLDKK